MNKIKKYYKDCELWLPKYPNFRIWKFRLKSETKKGKIIKIPDIIRDKKTLRKWLIKLTPLDCYYSSGCFLNPSRVRGTQTKNYLLFRDIPFDLDADEPYGEEELEIIRQSTISLIKAIRYKLDKKPKYIIFTGGKGFQVVYEFDNFDNNTINYLRFKGIDAEVTTDKYRVIRLPLTINKKGRLSVFLTETELKKGMNYIFKKSPLIYNPQDCGGRAERRKPMTNSLPSKVNGQAAGTAQTAPVRAIYVTNEVRGTKRFIPILKYKYHKVVSSPKKDMELLAEKYGLNEWFLIKTKKELSCISLVSCDKQRLQKILNSTSSYSQFEFKKFDKIFMRTSGINYKKDFPVRWGILRFNAKTKDFLFSKPHIDLLNHFKFSVNPYKNYIGYEKPRILEVRKR